MRIQRVEPGPGQESVWDYPRPPRLEDAGRRIRVVAGDVVIAESDRARRVLETSHPPTYYIPPDDVRMELLKPTREKSWCEWKGAALYYDLAVDQRQIADVGWAYPSPTKTFVDIRDHLAFYPHRVDCYVDEEQVRPQAGGFYGGWITSHVAGPFKGEPGTHGW